MISNSLNNDSAEAHFTLLLISPKTVRKAKSCSQCWHFTPLKSYPLLSDLAFLTPLLRLPHSLTRHFHPASASYVIICKL